MKPTDLQYKNIGIMLDIETLDNCPRSKVAAIAATVFSWDRGFEILDEFYVKLKWKGLAQVGRTKSKGTVNWWKRQPHGIQQEVLYSKEGRLKPAEALRDLTSFIRQVKSKYASSIYEKYSRSDITVWGNGAGFDQPILKDMYKQYFPKATEKGTLPSWKFWKERDCRTLEMIALQLLGKKRMEFLSGESNANLHHPLYDCIEQSEWVCGMLNELADKVALADFRSLDEEQEPEPLEGVIEKAKKTQSLVNDVSSVMSCLVNKVVEDLTSKNP